MPDARKWDREGKPRDGKRGSVDNAARLKKLAAGRAGADWSTADSKWILAIVHQASQCGGAVRFGLSRDGGAYAVGCYLEGSSETLYCNGGDDLGMFLQGIYEFFQQTYEAMLAEEAPKQAK